MKTPLSLRELDPERCALNNARVAQGWKDEIVVDYLSPTDQYLGLESTLDGMPCMAWLPLQRAVDFWLGHTAIPVEQIGADLALAFARDAFEEQPLPAILSILEWVRPSEVVDGHSDRRPRYRVAGTSIELFLDRLPPREQNTHPLPPDLTISVQQRFGPVNLTADEIAGLEPGDVVLIDRKEGQLLACGHALFNLSIHGDQIMLTPRDDNHADVHPDAAVGNVPSLNQLPVPVSFVLSTGTMTLAEVAALHPGVTLPLANGAPMVTLAAGGQSIAVGELVRMGQVLAVEITEVTRFSESAAPGSGAPE